MKKVLSIILTLCIMLGALPTFVLAADSDFEITESGYLTKYNGPGGDVEIPDEVQHIGAHAFYGCSSITTIEIPDSVTTIGSSAFANCSNLTIGTSGNPSTVSLIG